MANVEIIGGYAFLQTDIPTGRRHAGGAQMSGPHFETWSHENLVKFAKEAYEKLQRQDEELQRLRLEKNHVG